MPLEEYGHWNWWLCRDVVAVNRILWTFHPFSLQLVSLIHFYFYVFFFFFQNIIIHMNKDDQFFTRFINHKLRRSFATCSKFLVKYGIISMIWLLITSHKEMTKCPMSNEMSKIFSITHSQSHHAFELWWIGEYEFYYLFFGRIEVSVIFESRANK